MLVWGLLVVATCTAVELAKRLPLAATLARLVTHSRRAGQIIRARTISDHWKEKALPMHAAQLFKASVVLFGLILAVLVPFAAGEALALALETSLLDQLVTVAGSAASLAVAGAYLVLRNRRKHV